MDELATSYYILTLFNISKHSALRLKQNITLHNT